MAHSQLTVTTTYLDIPMGGNTPGALQNVPNADGTVGDNTAWLSGTAGDTGTTQIFDVNAYDGGLSKIYALINLTNNTDTDESLAAAATVVAHETGLLTFTVGGATDTTLITLIAG